VGEEGEGVNRMMAAALSGEERNGNCETVRACEIVKR
jgi:hypothetical protein